MEEGGPRNLQNVLLFEEARRERDGRRMHAEALVQRGTFVRSGGWPGLHTVVHEDEMVEEERLEKKSRRSVSRAPFLLPPCDR